MNYYALNTPHTHTNFFWCRISQNCFCVNKNNIKRRRYCFLWQLWIRCLGFPISPVTTAGTCCLASEHLKGYYAVASVAVHILYNYLNCPHFPSNSVVSNRSLETAWALLNLASSVHAGYRQAEQNAYLLGSLWALKYTIPGFVLHVILLSYLL